MIRQHMRGCRNFDIVLGTDLHEGREQRLLLEYICRHKPLVVVMSPSCTGLAGWAHYNRTMNPGAHERS
eukprot:4936055-Karenia_brevis.AAC.1